MLISSEFAGKDVTIALDAMGGDHAPDSILEGASKALIDYPEVAFLIYGDQNKLSDILKELPKLKDASTVIHTDTVISSTDKPSIALRRGRDSSMGLAIKSVRSGDADAVVSAGNTGALMALSKILLRTLPGIDRPAIGATFPTEKGSSVMLDMGANVSCDANNLFEFAVMGDAFARALLGFEKPSIGILNIGTEDVKGNEAVKAASAMLRDSDLNLNFHGHIEGNDIAKGTVDVVVTDGFSGNIALKTAEGTADMITTFLKQALKSTFIAKIGGLLVKRSLVSMLKKLDPRLHNGAMLLGLNGIVVKSHGGTDNVGFANAVSVAIELATHDINRQIIDEMVQFGHIPPDEEVHESRG